MTTLPRPLPTGPSGRTGPDPTPRGLATVSRGRLGPAAAVVLPVVLLVAAAALSLHVGARAVDPHIVWSVLWGTPAETMDEVVVAARVPRTLTAILVGAALAVAGVGVQGASRNPLGDPALLGLTAGAALGVVLGIALTPAAPPLAVASYAIAGAVVAGAVVVAAGRLGATGDTGLVLAGAAVTAGCAAVTSTLVIALPGVLDRFRFWGLGSVARATTAEIAVSAPLVAVGIGLVLTGGRALDALALGDVLARGLGASPTSGRAIVLTGVVVLSGVATALAGPVAFVGLFVPHLLRRLVGPGARRLTVLSALTGATVVLVADTVGRVVAPPGEVAVGVMTVVIGAPLLLAALRSGGLTTPRGAW